MDRLELTLKCMRSVQAGTTPPSELIIVVDNNPVLEGELRKRTRDTPTKVISNVGRGAADARSTAIRYCTAEIVAFIDDDAWAEPGWLEELKTAFESTSVVGAGGLVVPDWDTNASRIPDELLWVVGSTYKGHPEGRVNITRPIGASMAARREALVEVGGFPSDFGPRGGVKSSSNEELALFTLLRERFGPECILYVPTAVVHHFVPAARTTWQYLLGRCWAEGTSKAHARQRFGREVMGHDSSYVRDTLLPSIIAYLGKATRHYDAKALRDAGMCLLSLGVTGAGYSWQLSTRQATQCRQTRT
jgi:glycosyltransferase involved in cell wall biosynthesis